VSPSGDTRFEVVPEAYTAADRFSPDDGVYVVPVLINNAITLNCVVDSGAADVSISADVFTTLIRTGPITGSDFIGTGTYRLARHHPHSGSDR
jgi:hypothetical protein